MIRAFPENVEWRCGAMRIEVPWSVAENGAALSRDATPGEVRCRVVKYRAALGRLA